MIQEQEDDIIILKDNDNEIIEDDIKFIDKENIYCGDKNEEIKEIERVSAENLKRVKIYNKK